jgi:hypothetical protein
MSKRKRRVVAVAGSRSFPLTPEVGAQVVDLLRAFPQGTLFLTRGSEGFDQFVLGACDILGLPVEMRRSAGGGDNFKRDAEMALECGELLAFLDPRTVPDENTGTAHLIEKFLDKRRRVQSYSAHGDTLVYVGSMNE